MEAATSPSPTVGGRTPKTALSRGDAPQFNCVCVPGADPCLLCRSSWRFLSSGCSISASSTTGSLRPPSSRDSTIGVAHSPTASSSNALATRSTIARMAIPTVFVLGMIVALSLSVVRRGAALLRIIIYFPTLQASLIVALIWTFVIHPDFGLLNLGIRALTGVEGQLPRRSPFRHADHRDDRGLEGSRLLGDSLPVRTARAAQRSLSRRRAGRRRTDPPLLQPHVAADEADLLFRGHFRDDRQPAALRFRVRADRRRPGQFDRDHRLVHLSQPLHLLRSGLRRDAVLRARHRRRRADGACRPG